MLLRVPFGVLQVCLMDVCINEWACEFFFLSFSFTGFFFFFFLFFFEEKVWGGFDEELNSLDWFDD